MTSGFYKRRRGIVEHIETGTVDLLESGIHDYLCLKANLVIGNGFPLPAGVCRTSAAAIHAHCRRRVSLRTVQRVLRRLEEIGWIKTWPTKSGNYPTLICRASVHDLAGIEYRVNGAKTMDWRDPVYEPVASESQVSRATVANVASNREQRIEKREKSEKALGAKTTPPADPRFRRFYDSAYEAFRAKHGQPPTWAGKVGKQLQLFLAANPHVTAEEFQRRFGNYLQSSEQFTRSHGDSLAYFVAAFDRFVGGPILGRAELGGKNGSYESFDERRRRESVEAIRRVRGHLDEMALEVGVHLSGTSRN